MSKLIKILSTSVWGAIAGFNGYCASDYFSKVRGVREATEKIVSENYIMGIVSAVAASGALGYGIYNACRKDKK
ncbi:MAG: hypothetical protein Q8L29_03870 [archaeon]|nr:hypothetical protein [archaeon]